MKIPATIFTVIKKFLACFCLLGITLCSAAQDMTNSTRNSIYLETASKGALYSLNYERVFAKDGRLKKSFRAGAGIYNNTLAIPLGISLFKGKAPHHIEFNLLLTPYIEHYRSLFNGTNTSDKKGYVMPGIGYRYQPLQKSFFAKIIAGPVLYLDPPSNDFWNMQSKWYAGINVAAGFSW